MQVSVAGKLAATLNLLKKCTSVNEKYMYLAHRQNLYFKLHLKERVF